MILHVNLKKIVRLLAFQWYNSFQQMLKGVSTLKEEEILSQGITLLKKSLSGIPFFNNAVVEPRLLPGQSNRADLIISIPGKEYLLMIEARSSGQPRYAREAINALLLIRNQNPQVYGIIIAPFISEQAAKICEDADIGYLDLSGNCRLSFQSIFIQKEGQPNQFIIKRKLSSLYSAKSERILRVLLTYPYRSWRTKELAQKASVSLGLVSYVKKHLDDREWIKVSIDGFALSQPQALLDEWGKNYSYRRNDISDYYTLLSPADLEKKLREVCSENHIFYALTGFSAANHYAPTVRNQRTMVYLSGDIGQVAQQLGLKPVTSGANVSIFKPYDDGVYLESREVNGILAATPIQVYLDLKNYRGRGEEAAETIYREIIQKQWSKQKTTTLKQ